MSKRTNKPTIDWDHFAGQWLRTVRALRRDSNYCRLALAMARADDHRLGWGEYMSLAATWRAVWDDRENAAHAQRCAHYVGLGWAINVQPDGQWRAETLDLATIGPRLGSILADLQNDLQPKRERWEEHRRALAQHTKGGGQ